jgi:hypothetical protein
MEAPSLYNSSIGLDLKYHHLGLRILALSALMVDTVSLSPRAVRRWMVVLPLHLPLDFEVHNNSSSLDVLVVWLNVKGIGGRLFWYSREHHPSS